MKTLNIDSPPSDDPVGRIGKYSGDAFTEIFTNADLLGVEFYEGATVEHKALLMAAMFLIDFKHFESLK